MATRFAQRLMREARGGDAQAQASLGKLYLSGGEGLPASEKAALHWLALAARAGVADADQLIAECIALDRAGSEIHEHKDACRRAAEQGHPAGHCALGDIYASSSEAKADLERAQAAYRAAAQAGHTAAARKLGLLLANGASGDAPHPREEAAHWLQSAAIAGDRSAAQSLGTLLWHNGDRNAVRWLEPDAQAGDPEAMYRLGEILCNQPQAEHARSGAYWLERAARLGHAQALWRFGRMHVRSFSQVPTGLPHSPLQASRLLERAAAAGVSEALWDLARIYEMPRFSRRDIGKARQCLEQAARAGIGEAELELGKRLSRYKNDRNAWIAAGRWLSKASEKGFSEAQNLLERIADRAVEWPHELACRQEEILDSVRDNHPIIAARLELAARFDLSPREMLFLDPLNASHGWGLEIDLSRYFKRMPWRLVLISSPGQRLALTRATDAFLAPESRGTDLSATTTTGRARQLSTICSRLAFEPALFVRAWNMDAFEPTKTRSSSIAYRQVTTVRDDS